MNNSWLSLLLWALAASYVPLPIGFEIVLLSKADGFKKGVSFGAGITLFRIVLGVGLAVFFTSFFNNT